MTKPSVLAYTHFQRTGNPTSGVGKHIINMVRGLATSPEISLKLIAPRDLLTKQGQPPSDSMLRDLPVQALPWKRKWLERSSKILNWPSIDRWVGRPDCIYCPAEVYLRTQSRLIITVHDVVPLETDLPWSNERESRTGRRFWELFYSRLRKSHAELVTVSDFSRRRIAALTGFPEQRIHIVGNGVEEQYFNAAPLPPDPAVRLPYVLVVGISERKGADSILALSRQLLAENNPLTIVAAGALQARYRPAVEAQSNIIHLSQVPDERLPGLMQNAVALLQLSIYEGFGIPVVEAMAIGTPAVVSSSTSLPEIAGPAGIIFDMQRPDVYRALIDTLHQLEVDTGFRAEVTARGRAWASRFHWSSCVDALKRVILAGSAQAQ